MLSASESRVHLGVMAKYWQAGQVKTRLGAELGMGTAAELHRELCLHLARTLCDAADSRSFVIDPPSRRSEFTACLPPAWQTELQSDGDLGKRMRAWFAGASPPGPVAKTGSGQGSDAVLPIDREDRILIGADCPWVTVAVVHQAAALLQSHPIVLGPASDGGYYLLGLRGGWRPEYEGLLTDMPWSTDSVLEQTCLRAAEAGLSLALLDERDDIDTRDDLIRVLKQLNDSIADPETLRLKDTLQRLLALGERR